MKTTVFDYGAGNLRSVANALDSLDTSYEVIADAASLRRATRIILPGVGHYGQLLRSMDRLDARNALCDKIASGTPFLGICLGLQALFQGSDEAEVDGLAVYPGRVTRFPAGTRVPQMGWNRLDLHGDPRLLRGVGDSPYVYFANSFYVPAETAADRAAATCTYADRRFCAALEAGSVFGVQFHPEKSGPIGQRILRNFLEVEPC